ncbi:MAG: hypothetical protein L0H84_13095, partial [Pseudonocardia sp.]|nr:hypothetical protein [Pseudonocardia sp.]
IGDDLVAKSDAMRALAGDDPAAMDAAALRELLGHVFCARRRVEQIFAVVHPEALAAGIADLLNGAGGVARRFDAFAGLLAGPGTGGVAADLPGELLHFLDPRRYWLWSRWMWDPDAETGSLRLVTMDEVDLDGTGPGETYLLVGQALAFVEETGKAAGFTTMGAGQFGTDVFLAAVYGIYMKTVLRMRLTQEFTHVVPPLPALVRRLLGVHHLQNGEG